ncbi:MAG: adenosylcobinamide-GDP ribazoletransferase [Rhodobacteraceae bacterium]|nr:adenosylcobinamide-GDP ribazoletransferase [Paracoccaceae bacterium]
MVNNNNNLSETLQARDVLIAATLLTRLPVRLPSEQVAARMPASFWAFPVIGVVVGLAAGGVFAALASVGVAVGMAAAAALAVQIWVTGGLHEDGAADMADGFGGGHSGPRVLEIMRDSRIGAFGAMALVLVLLARWGALINVAPLEGVAALVVAGAASRAAVVGLMWSLPPARADGLSALVGRPNDQSALIAVAIGLGLTLFLGVAIAGFGALAAILAGAVAVWVIGQLAARRIGGQTGDVLGAAQQACEVTMLAALTVS